ncbi:MAG: hypothetical protein DYG87_00030 [Anaerolineae bacterium CFX3]|nr:hypothetical protein [Anaerolineales bacterium]MCC7511919.1 sugar transferase [Anaerolineae bacterium]MCE7904165.1 hypothetical protein [Anaerolineae bacterium CFX3]OQY82666.1 MAG: hypothetical protein B6D40_08495 [Anaerolineae bacterium UTCFX3]MCQ3946098.1 hypothetical protein [Anaerolineae bacterium]
MTRSTTKQLQAKPVKPSRLSVALLSRAMREAAKRAFDAAAAFFGLLVLSPFFAVIAILIKRDTPGPVFYWGARIGRNGVPFKILKFRTMYETPESYRGLRVTCEGDERITPFGKWLHETKLNEIPQLWNVLIGEMSLVGPRPEDPSIARAWPAQAAREILSARPGITSPASILYRNEESMLHAGEVMQKYLHELSPDKMRLDQLYVRYQSFWLDLDVILWTAILLVPKIKAYSPPENLLFAGPLTRLFQRYVGWFLADFLVALGAIAIVGGPIHPPGLLNPVGNAKIGMALATVILYSLTGLALGVNRINWQKAGSREAGRFLASWIISSAAILGLHIRLGLTGARVPETVLAASLLTLLGMTAVRYRRRLAAGLFHQALTRRAPAGAARERVLVVGSGRTAEHIAWLMEHPAYSRKFQIVGFIDNDLRAQGMNIYGSRIVGKVEDIRQIVQKSRVDLIILADNQMASHKYSEFHNTASFLPARIAVAPDIFGSLSSLDGGASNGGLAKPLDNFQCRHCLARRANESEERLPAK